MGCAAHALARSGGMLCEADVDLIREAVAKLSPNSLVVDLGVGWGTTALSVFAERQDIEVISFDCHEEALERSQLALKHAGVPLEKWYGIQADSAFREGEVILRYGGEPTTLESVGLVILDTSHLYTDTVAEIKAWLPRLASNGYMLFHDYDAKNAICHWPEVKKAVDPFLEMGQLDRVKRQGWSLLTRKAEPK